MKKVFLLAAVVITAAIGLYSMHETSRVNAENPITMENIEALSRGESGEQACVEHGSGCPFHGLWIAKSHEY